MCIAEDLMRVHLIKKFSNFCDKQHFRIVTGIITDNFLEHADFQAFHTVSGILAYLHKYRIKQA